MRTADRFVQVATVQAATESARAYTGVVAARVQSDLGFRVQGKIVSSAWLIPGRSCDAGQRFDAHRPHRLYAHAVTVQSGDVASAARATLDTGFDADEKRYRGLVASGAISRNWSMMTRRRPPIVRKALLAAGEAQEKVARNQGDYTRCCWRTADGTIVETLAEPGQVVSGRADRDPAGPCGAAVRPRWICPKRFGPSLLSVRPRRALYRRRQEHANGTVAATFGFG